MTAAPGPARTPGRVHRSGRGTCDVVPADRADAVTAAWSPAVHRAVAADPSTTPVAGDLVELDLSGDRPVVAAVLPRRTALLRAEVTPGSSHPQVLAANLDAVVVVEAMAPDLEPGRVERLLALAWASGAEPLLVLTKADLVADPDAVVRSVSREAPGVEVLAVDSPAGTGLAPLRGRLADGAVLALLGASGAGKSTLLNALVGAPAMATRALRADGKGRHTTVTREYHPVPGGGAIIDTPGLRSVGLTGPDHLGNVFAEVLALAEDCRFSDCAHGTEPGCAVLAAVAAGDLSPRRLENYRALLREAAYQAARTDARLRAEQSHSRRVEQRARRRLPVRRPDERRLSGGGGSGRR